MAIAAAREGPAGDVERINRFQTDLASFEPAADSQKLLHAETLRAYNEMIKARRLRLDAVSTGLPTVIQTESILPGLCGIALMLAGIGVRWLAIYTLGKFFTRKVTILNDHRVVQSGLYKYLRHPSYSGFLLGNLGFGLAFSNWLSLIVIFVPTFAAALYRMRVEERALAEALGSEYINYCRATYRLIPKLY